MVSLLATPNVHKQGIKDKGNSGMKTICLLYVLLTNLLCNKGEQP